MIFAAEALTNAKSAVEAKVPVLRKPSLKVAR